MRKSWKLYLKSIYNCLFCNIVYIYKNMKTLNLNTRTLPATPDNGDGGVFCLGSE